jgi:hypothetical protein
LARKSETRNCLDETPEAKYGKRMRNRNPKPEIRRPKEGRNPKESGDRFGVFGLRISAFFRPSDFGFRISIPHSPATAALLSLDSRASLPESDHCRMKSAYELAMERLSKASPVVKLSAEQKKQIAELESKCAAKIAEREISVKGEMLKAVERGDGPALEQLEKQLVSDRKSLKADFEEKKEKVRQGKAK